MDGTLDFVENGEGRGGGVSIKGVPSAPWSLVWERIPRGLTGHGDERFHRGGGGGWRAGNENRVGLINHRETQGRRHPSCGGVRIVRPSYKWTMVAAVKRP